MLLWITHTTDIRVTELAEIEIADVLYPSVSVVVHYEGLSCPQHISHAHQMH